MYLISTAHAAAESTPKSGGVAELVMIGLFIVIFYFLLWRPQMKRQKAHESLLNSLQKGDEVVTSGGILGRITKIKDNFMVIALSEGVEVKCQKQAISNVLPKGTIKSVG